MWDSDPGQYLYPTIIWDQLCQDASVSSLAGMKHVPKDGFLALKAREAKCFWVPLSFLNWLNLLLHPYDPVEK